MQNLMQTKIAVLGIGGGGVNTLNALAGRNNLNVNLIGIDPDTKSCIKSNSLNLLDADLSQESVNCFFAKLEAALSNCRLLFLVAGLGGNIRTCGANDSVMGQT